MAELLLELFSEEIPARMQARAAGDLERLMTEALNGAGIEHSTARNFSTPRRLTLVIDGLPERQPDQTSERKGPRLGAPDKAIEGFLKAAGLDSLDQCDVREDAKGKYHVAVIHRKGASTADVIAGIVPDIIGRFPWPKSMRWGAGSLRWVRPLHAILCVVDGRVVPFEVGELASGNVTFGHRFMAPGAFDVAAFADYVAALEKARVVLDAGRRRAIILDEAERLADEHGLEVVADDALLDEVAGLVEWPVVLTGTFDEAFLEVPPEVLTTSMKSHQKCFSLKDPKTDRLANRFITVANLAAKDGGRAIIAGNERVIAARLSDARFFWEQDLKVTLEDRLPALDEIVFHKLLGTQGERVGRLMVLAREIAPLVGAEADKAERAAQLCKADLVTAMVGEFPELQGLMGRYYALAQGEDDSVARAIEQHYRPQGPSDAVPSDPVAVAVALADKLDTLVGFWAIDEKPTGSKDPYALRRAALGVIRLILEGKRKFPLRKLFSSALELYRNQRDQEFGEDRGDDLLAFFADRLKVHLRDEGVRHDLIDAVFSSGREDDLLMIVTRVAALGRFLDTGDGANLLAGLKRADNILRIEEKKDEIGGFDKPPETRLMLKAEEKALHAAIRTVRSEVKRALDRDDFTAAMTALSGLRAPVDTFFDKITVNADDPALRRNRLRLLGQIRAETRAIADFSKIEG